MTYQSSFTNCPCCRFPTLTVPAGYETCPICWWEDDGQDDATADEVWGGPNAHYSLSAARRNFADHRHIYDLGQGIDAVETPSDQRLKLIAYVDAICAGEEQLSETRLHQLIQDDEQAFL